MYLITCAITVTNKYYNAVSVHVIDLNTARLKMRIKRRCWDVIDDNALRFYSRSSATVKSAFGS